MIENHSRAILGMVSCRITVATRVRNTPGPGVTWTMDPLHSNFVTSPIATIADLGMSTRQIIVEPSLLHGAERVVFLGSP